MGERQGRRRRGPIVLVAVVLTLLLIEGALVAAVFVSPTAAERLRTVVAAAEDLWTGTEERPGIRDRAAEAAANLYRDWIDPLWGERRPRRPSPEFAACVECHRDYASRRVFGVYMNHPLHAELGLACEDCHPTNPHPNPPRPTEDMCADCHPEVRERDGCVSCHPPGSLPHFYLLGAPRDAVVACDVCHPTETFIGRATEPQLPPRDYSGADEELCLSCHEDATCQRCHAEPHPEDWIALHPNAALEGAATCYACHAGAWCTDRCHAPTPPRPLPTPGVRP
jgi:hypothetical protein